MVTSVEVRVRKVTEEDRVRVANLIHFELRVHRNLDWKPPLEWIGAEPFLVYEKNNRLLAALACPPDPPEIAWVRLFAVHAAISEREAWRELWPQTRDFLEAKTTAEYVAAIPQQSWFREMLLREDFENLQNVVMLSWTGIKIPEAKKTDAIRIRPMNFDDLQRVEGIDRRAFSAMWRNSLTALEIAYRQASLATVAMSEDEMVGYQISTSNSMGGHLARLAVLPKFQGKGIGYSLVRDVLVQFRQRGANQVTVNTQSNNQASKALYASLGFKPTGQIYPVYQKPLQEKEI
jgi:ribosomal protein S18 acetylase RimI-like enzyme